TPACLPGCRPELGRGVSGSASWPFQLRATADRRQQASVAQEATREDQHDLLEPGLCDASQRVLDLTSELPLHALPSRFAFGVVGVGIGRTNQLASAFSSNTLGPCLPGFRDTPEGEIE